MIGIVPTITIRENPDGKAAAPPDTLITEESRRSGGIDVKMNCWEFKNCKRGPGSNGDACPAWKEMRLDGVHNGKNGGRACWVVAGTFCGGTVQGTFAKKYNTCEKCEFYRLVKQEEVTGFMLSAVLLTKIR